MEIRRFVFTYWATCFLTTGLDAPIAKNARLDNENLHLSQNFESDLVPHISSVPIKDVEHCDQYCNIQKQFPSYCDIRCPVPVKCCKEFQSNCPQTSLNNQTDRFANTKITCELDVFMISSCSTNDSSTIQPDSFEKERDFNDFNIKIKQNIFFDQVINIAPVTDLYTGFTYVNFEVYKRYAENKSEPIFWIAELQTNLDLDLSIYDAFNNYLNTSYFHSMNVSFKRPELLGESSLSTGICRFLRDETFNEKFKFSILLSLTNAEVRLDARESRYTNPIVWTKVQCDLFKTSNQKDLYPCQVQGCNSYSRLLDGQCKQSQRLLLAFQVSHFLDFDHERLLSYAKCYLHEHTNLHVKESSHLPAINYLMWRQEKHIVFTLIVFVNHLSNNEVEYSEHILNMTWSMFFLIQHSKTTNQNMNSLSEKRSIGLDTHRVCFAFLKAEFNWNITRFLENSLVCSDVHVNVSLILDDKEYQLRFSCRHHLNWSEGSSLYTASLLSKYVIALGLLIFVHLTLDLI
ncbi:hypothetical protein BgiMline_012322 [Biomphalaria glabrata]|nr:hypothetical protein BgiMline_032374 [Biomphalaria glabrata]